MKHEFIKLGTQAVIGSKYVPKEVIQGPQGIFLWRQRIHCRINIIPQWLSLICSELITAAQIPVALRLDCNWSRNLTNFKGEQLQAATNMTNENLELSLRENLEMAARYHISFYRMDDLIVPLEADEWQLTAMKRNRRHLACCLWDKIRQQFGYIGLTLHELNINVTLPAHSQQERQDIWQLKNYQGQPADLIDRKLALAFAKSQPAVNLLMTQSPNTVDKIVNLSEPAIETAYLLPQSINGNGNGNGKKPR